MWVFYKTGKTLHSHLHLHLTGELRREVGGKKTASWANSAQLKAFIKFSNFGPMVCLSHEQLEGMQQQTSASSKIFFPQFWPCRDPMCLRKRQTFCRNIGSCVDRYSWLIPTSTSRSVLKSVKHEKMETCWEFWHMKTWSFRYIIRSNGKIELTFVV